MRLSLVLSASVYSAYAAVVPTKGKDGAVVSEVAECSDAGVGILKLGGSAADAIIATGLCVGTINAYHSGIGGGGFALVRSQSEQGESSYEMIDFRETMPGLGHETMYINNTIPDASTIGGLSVGTPGELRGWETLHKRHGKLPWKTLFQPAIGFAQSGFKVNGDLARYLDPIEYPFLVNEPIWAEVYAPNGQILTEGQTCYRRRLAKTLTTLAEEGPDAFYNGPIADNIVSAAASTGGIITANDLANYTALLRKPANITYRDKYRIFSTVAPSSGSVVLSALKVFEGYDGSALPTDPAINITTHRLIQATKFAYGQRTNYGDPAFTANVSVLEQAFLQDEAVQDVREAIDDNSTFPAIYYNSANYLVLDDSGTSHMAAVDRWGNVVSLTTTINLYWGSAVMTEDGILLNDEMDDFSSPGSTNAFGFAASPANYIRPFKRPQSSISSSIAEDLETGEFVIATGAAGGSRIITATLQHLYHHLDQGMSASDSVHQSRWHDQIGTDTFFETPFPKQGLPGFDNSTVAYLAAMQYNVSYQDTTGSAGHIIARGEDGTLEAAGDPRQLASGASVY